ncbi:MAG: hypothetical protein HY811_04065 [Planctomycetes bacterium]|nr:hypothetical protein [Planctomycetota bacterium]
MTQRRVLLVLGIVTFLAFVTVWQRIQTAQWGYRISEAMEAKKKLNEERETLRVELSSVTSPQYLFALAQEKKIVVSYGKGEEKTNSRITAMPNELQKLLAEYQ